MTPETRELKWISTDAAAAGRGEPRLLDEPFPPRDVGEISGLVSSIRLLGVISPILCRVTRGGLEVVCGHRRVRAARAAGLKRIPAVVARMDDAEAIRCYLSENQERRILSARAEDEANESLRSLRDGQQQTRVKEPIEVREPASRIGPVVSGSRIAPTEPAPVHEGLERIFERTRAFFEEVRATRSINVPRTEILVDGVLEELAAGAPFERFRSRRMPPAEVIAAHGLLVTALAARAASHLGWTEDEARDLAVGSFLHDAGMVFVTCSGLGQARSLSAEDRSQVQSHTRIGYALVSGAREWREGVAILARDHHERWNGTGYPGGLVGNETGLPARVLGLVDTFAAMIAARPHRDPIEPAHAVERLRKAMEMGLFDPSLGPVLTGVLATFVAGGASPAFSGNSSRQLATPPRNSVELMGSMTTMLAKGST